MNRSWNSKSNPSPGFVYFQQDRPYQNSNDSSDYLSFGNSPNHCSPNNRNKFSPSHFSSPRFKQNFNRYSMKQSYRYPEHNRNRSFNSSNESFGSYDSFGSNDSFRGRNRHRRKIDNSNYQNSSRGGKRDMSVYLDLTCTKDPWKQLETIENEKKIIVEQNRVEPNENNSDDNSSSEDETESVSEEKSSSSTAEDETA